MASYEFHDAAAISPAEIYRWMTSLVVPRPIAWVSTVSESGVVNLAPFSFFNAVCSKPPTLVFSVARKRDGSKKDTLKNIEANSEFVVNVSVRSEAVRINATSFPYAPEVSEMIEAGCTPLPSTHVRPPRIAESPAHFECRLDRIIEVGDGSAGSASLVLGRILGVHVNETILREGRADPRLLDPVSRLGGHSWGALGDVFELPRSD